MVCTWRMLLSFEQTPQPAILPPLLIAAPAKSIFAIWRFQTNVRVPNRPVAGNWNGAFGAVAARAHRVVAVRAGLSTGRLIGFRVWRRPSG